MKEHNNGQRLTITERLRMKRQHEAQVARNENTEEFSSNPVGETSSVELFDEKITEIESFDDYLKEDDANDDDLQRIEKDDLQGAMHKGIPRPSSLKNLDTYEGPLLADDLYFEELKKRPLLKAEQEVELGKRIESGDEEEARQASHELIESNLRLVVSIAKRYQGSGMDLLEIIQLGNMGLFKATEKYDWRKGFKFSTYATWWIRQSIHRGIQDTNRIIRLPVHAQEDLKKVKKSEERLRMQYGRQPTNEEIADELEIPIGRVMRAREIVDPVSGDKSIGDGSTVLFDYISDKGKGDQEAFDLLEQSDFKRVSESLLSILNSRERFVIEGRYGIGNSHPMTLQEVATEMDITRERVRQIQKEAEGKMRNNAKRGNSTTSIKEMLGGQG